MFRDRGRWRHSRRGSVLLLVHIDPLHPASDEAWLGLHGHRILLPPKRIGSPAVVVVQEDDELCSSVAQAEIARRRHAPVGLLQESRAPSTGGCRCATVPSLPPSSTTMTAVLPRISVVIPSFNTRTLLAACLRSLEATRDACELGVVVVDNASRDGSAEMVARDFPWVRLLTCRRNLGYSGGVNRGLRWADGELVVILNADTAVRPESLLTLHRELLADPTCGAGCPKILSPDGTLQANGFRFLRSKDFLGMIFGKAATDEPRDPDRSAVVDTPSGACLCLTRRGLDAIGQLDDGLEIYLEEQDVGRRLAAAGLRTLYVAEATVTHLGGQSARQLDPWEHFAATHRARARFVRKHFSFLTAVVINSLGAAGAMARAANSAQQLLRGIGDRRFAWRGLRTKLAVARSYLATRDDVAPVTMFHEPPS